MTMQNITFISDGIGKTIITGNDTELQKLTKGCRFKSDLTILHILFPVSTVLSMPSLMNVMFSMTGLVLLLHQLLVSTAKAFGQEMEIFFYDIDDLGLTNGGTLETALSLGSVWYADGTGRDGTGRNSGPMLRLIEAIQRKRNREADHTWTGDAELKFTEKVAKGRCRR
ncbi:hypothetical protein EV2_048418 [Malus domestica]